MDRLMFVGPGRVGLALGLALRREDAVDRLLYCGRHPDPPANPLFHRGEAEYFYGLRRPDPGTTAVVLSVPDEAIPEVAYNLAELGRAPEGCVALHCSGALSTEVLAPLHAQGYSVGSLHPLQTIANPVSGAQMLEGSAFSVAGEREGVLVAKRLVRSVGGWSFTIPVGMRPVYHAAAVMASNYTLALLAASARMLVEAGAPEDDALDALLPLVRGTLDNLGEMGPAGALTGPLSRGDRETVRLHLAALPPRERAVYATMGRETLKLAASGLPSDVVESLDQLLASYEDR